MSNIEKKWACVKNGKVELVIVWDGIQDWPPAAEYEIIELTETTIAGVGFDYKNGAFIDNRPQESSDE